MSDSDWFDLLGTTWLATRKRSALVREMSVIERTKRGWIFYVKTFTYTVGVVDWLLDID
jgi:hypothetical protein